MVFSVLVYLIRPWYLSCIYVKRQSTLKPYWNLWSVSAQSLQLEKKHANWHSIYSLGFFTPTGGRKFYGNYFCFNKFADYRQEYGSIDPADSKTGQNQVLLKICSEIQLFTWENGRKGWLHLLHQRQPVQNLKEKKKRKLFEWIPFLEYLVLSEWHLSNMDLSLT